jgi:uncharacterized CHY-type Zn-finger protein
MNKKIKSLSDNEVKKMLKKARHKCPFCGGYDTAFCCMECRNNARLQGINECISQELRQECLMCGKSLRDEIIKNKIHIHLCSNCRKKILNKKTKRKWIK